MVVLLLQADVDTDVQPTVGAERKAVEAVESLRSRVDHLLLGELGAGPTAPSLQLELEALRADRGAADVQRALAPRQAPDEVRRAVELGRRAALQQEDPAVGRCRARRLRSAVTLEHVAAAEGERRRSGEPPAGGEQLDLHALGPYRCRRSASCR